MNLWEFSVATGTEVKIGWPWWRFNGRWCCWIFDGGIFPQVGRRGQPSSLYFFRNLNIYLASSCKETLVTAVGRKSLPRDIYLDRASYQWDPGCTQRHPTPDSRKWGATCAPLGRSQIKIHSWFLCVLPLSIPPLGPLTLTLAAIGVCQNQPVFPDIIPCCLPVEGRVHFQTNLLKLGSAKFSNALRLVELARNQLHFDGFYCWDFFLPPVGDILSSLS